MTVHVMRANGRSACGLSWQQGTGQRCGRFECSDPNPLVCVCPVPLAHPGVNLGECYRCHRKPLALFSILQPAPTFTALSPDGGTSRTSPNRPLPLGDGRLGATP